MGENAAPSGAVEPKDIVEVRLPAASAYLSVLRTATAGLAARLDFTLDEIEDLRIAVDEACAMLLSTALPGTSLRCTFELEPDLLRIAVSVQTSDGVEPSRNTFAWTVLTALAGEVDSSASGDGTVTIELIKRRGSGSGMTDNIVTDPSQEPAVVVADEDLQLDPALVEVLVAPTTQELREDRTRQDRNHARELFAQLVDPAVEDGRRQRIRDELVEMHLPLVEYLARRFRNRGEPLDDLIQVATIGLIKSVDRFDLERGVEFSTYATPTIVGEIKRHFRDKGWAIRVPRRLQELKLALTKATQELSQRNGRSPTVAELAGHLKMTEEEVLEGLESANAYSAVSLDAPDGGDDDSPSVQDTLGITDEAIEGVEYRESLKPLLEKLPPREKKILLLRFFGNMTQSQIATELGISQMHVSRLLARTLAQLRQGLLVDE